MPITGAARATADRLSQASCLRVRSPHPPPEPGRQDTQDHHQGMQQESTEQEENCGHPTSSQHPFQSKQYEGQEPGAASRTTRSRGGPGCRQRRPTRWPNESAEDQGDVVRDQNPGRPHQSPEEHGFARQVHAEESSVEPEEMDERSYEGREEAVSILGAVPEIKITRKAPRVESAPSPEPRRDMNHVRVPCKV